MPDHVSPLVKTLLRLFHLLQSKTITLPWNIRTYVIHPSPIPLSLSLSSLPIYPPTHFHGHTNICALFHTQEGIFLPQGIHLHLLLSLPKKIQLGFCSNVTSRERPFLTILCQIVAALYHFLASVPCSIVFYSRLPLCLLTISSHYDVRS